MDDSLKHFIMDPEVIFITSSLAESRSAVVSLQFLV